MDHVNNAVYADWLDEAVLAAGGGADVRAIPRLVRLEYARAAEPGATVGHDLAGSRATVVVPGHRCRRGGPASRPAGAGRRRVGHATRPRGAGRGGDSI